MEIEEPLVFDSLKKKKKKLGAVPIVEDMYDYAYLLSRAHIIMSKDGLNRGEDIKLKLPPLELGKIGTRKTIWVNFEKVCHNLNRNPETVMKYVLVELGAEGNLNAEKSFIINERTQVARIERILRNYISEYVLCKNCKTYDTYTERRSKLDFLICKSCNSERSLVKIDHGFQALVKKRSTLKARDD